MSTTEARMKIITEGVRTFSASALAEVVRKIGRTDDNDLKMARAALLAVYEERVGEDAADTLRAEILGL